MSPKEKAQELIKQFSPLVTTWDCYYDTPRNGDDILTDAKKCAIIALGLLKSTRRKGPDYDYSFWDEVEKEIELL